MMQSSKDDPDGKAEKAKEDSPNTRPTKEMQAVRLPEDARATTPPPPDSDALDEAWAPPNSEVVSGERDTPRATPVVASGDTFQPPRSEGSTRTPLVLIIDPDGASQRVVGGALTKEKMSFVAARDSEEAEEVLARNVVDLVLCETVLPDGLGVPLLKRLKRQSKLMSTPFIFLSSDNRPASRLQAFRAGARDFILKPIDGVELAARVSAHIADHRSYVRTLSSQAKFSGTFEMMPFTEVMRTVARSHMTGRLAIATTRGFGTVSFDAGKPISAEHETVRGESAFRALASGGRTFDFVEDQTAFERELEGADFETLLGQAETLEPRSFVTMAPSPRMVPWLAPSPTTAVQIEVAVKDPFTLGDLEVFDDVTLTGWTSQQEQADRFHALFMADMSEGIPAMLALAATPSDQWVLRSLNPSAKALGLTFNLRGGRTVDIVLLDLAHPGAFRSALKRVPCLTIVAPPAGDLGDRGASDLEAFMSAVAPTSVMTHGDKATEATVAQFAPVRNKLVSHVHIAREEATIDLRLLLVAGIRHWGTLSLPRS